MNPTRANPSRASAKAVENVSELILRSPEPLASQHILLVNPPRDNLRQKLGGLNAEVSLFTQDFADHGWFAQSTVNVQFGVLPDEQALPPRIIVFQPKEKARLELLLHFLACHMPADGELWLVGENRSGIKSAGKRLAQYFGQVEKTDTARHCGLYRASQPQHEPAFELENHQEKWLLGGAGEELKFVSLPGAFAHGRLDKGTELLLAYLREQAATDGKATHQPAGAVLDFGCGIGVIGLSLLRRDPAIWLTLLDSSALALESARLSLAANEMQATVIASDGLNELQSRFDWIVSNPPFHRGVATDYDTVQRFIADAGKKLTRQGKLLLVCNRHLPYEAWLENGFATVENLHQNSHFKLLLASRPQAAAVSRSNRAAASRR